MCVCVREREWVDLELLRIFERGVCVCERERERESERDKEPERERLCESIYVARDAMNEVGSE